ncbi:MAG TPA: hypothetical protein VGB37_08560, partial [Candidatus Lokiarchaeia archaeon]
MKYSLKREYAIIGKYIEKTNPQLVKQIRKDISCNNNDPEEKDILILKQIIKENPVTDKQFQIYFISSFLKIYQFPALLVKEVCLRPGLRYYLSFYLDVMGEGISRTVSQVKCYYEHIPQFRQNTDNIVTKYNSLQNNN